METIEIEVKHTFESMIQRRLILPVEPLDIQQRQLQRREKVRIVEYKDSILYCKSLLRYIMYARHFNILRKKYNIRNMNAC